MLIFNGFFSAAPSKKLKTTIDIDKFQVGRCSSGSGAGVLWRERGVQVETGVSSFAGADNKAVKNVHRVDKDVVLKCPRHRRLPSCRLRLRRPWQLVGHAVEI